jgi:predicted transcriptional regulator
MDFNTAAKLGNYLAKDYAEGFFGLLVNYKDISASEAASRLNLHINTAQEFLEAMTSLGLVSREEVHEGKRPYFRYSLKTTRITIDVDLSSVKRMQSSEESAERIREAKDANARFSTARGGQSISSIAVWTGKGRDRAERKINLTTAQGLFLYYLPFPDGEPLTRQEIMRKGGVDESLSSEIADIIGLLIEYNVIEVTQ